jgi:hypothetical protein
MSFRRLEEIQDGDVSEFLQTYLNGEPKIFCKNFGKKEVLEEAYSFLGEILREYKIPYENLSEESLIPKLNGEDYSYEGVGRVTKERGIIKIWGIPGYSYNKRHLNKYAEKFRDMRFDASFIIKKEEQRKGDKK